MRIVGDCEDGWTAKSEGERGELYRHSHSCTIYIMLYITSVLIKLLIVSTVAGS